MKNKTDAVKILLANNWTIEEIEKVFKLTPPATVAKKRKPKAK